MQSEHFEIGAQSEVWVGKFLFEKMGAVKGQKVALVCDANVPEAFVENLKAFFHPLFIPVSGGEAIKSRQMKEHIEDQLLAAGFGRGDLIVACGGGATLDLVGYVAATYHRGLPLVLIPSTLLAMVDASIGGKNGINIGGFKNIVGTTHHPQAVFVDVELLRGQDLTTGLMEMCKHALLDGNEACARFEKFLNNLHSEERLIAEIACSMKIKKRFVEASQGNGAIRDCLNLGHTIAHAIESLEHFQISHGKAVAMGLLAESYLAYASALLDKSELQRVEELICRVGLELQLQRAYSFDEWYAACCRDKKSVHGRPRFVLLRAIGKVHEEAGAFSHTVSKEHLFEALKWLQEHIEVQDAVCVDTTTK